MHACFVASVCCFTYLWKYDTKCLIVPRLQMVKNPSWIGFSSKTYWVNLLTEITALSSGEPVGFQMFRDFYLFNNRGSFMNTWHWLWRHKAPSAPPGGFFPMLATSSVHAGDFPSSLWVFHEHHVTHTQMNAFTRLTPCHYPEPLDCLPVTCSLAIALKAADSLLSVSSFARRSRVSNSGRYVRNSLAAPERNFRS